MATKAKVCPKAVEKLGLTIAYYRLLAGVAVADCTDGSAPIVPLPKPVASPHVREVSARKHPTAPWLRDSQVRSPFGNDYIPIARRPAEIERAWRTEADKYFGGAVAVLDIRGTFSSKRLRLLTQSPWRRQNLVNN